MLDKIMNFILTHWVNSLTLQEFVKDPDAPCCVVVLVKGIAINDERRLAGHAGISHKSMFNCGFQDNDVLTVFCGKCHRQASLFMPHTHRR